MPAQVNKHSIKTSPSSSSLNVKTSGNTASGNPPNVDDLYSNTNTKTITNIMHASTTFSTSSTSLLSTTTLSDKDKFTVVKKHGLKDHFALLPLITEVERLNKFVSKRFISQHGGYLIGKFGGIDDGGVSGGGGKGGKSKRMNGSKSTSSLGSSMQSTTSLGQFSMQSSLSSSTLLTNSNSNASLNSNSKSSLSGRDENKHIKAYHQKVNLLKNKNTIKTLQRNLNRKTNRDPAYGIRYNRRYDYKNANNGVDSVDGVDSEDSVVGEDEEEDERNEENINVQHLQRIQSNPNRRSLTDLDLELLNDNPNDKINKVEELDNNGIRSLDLTAMIINEKKYDKKFYDQRKAEMLMDAIRTPSHGNFFSGNSVRNAIAINNSDNDNNNNNNNISNNNDSSVNTSLKKQKEELPPKHKHTPRSPPPSYNSVKPREFGARRNRHCEVCEGLCSVVDDQSHYLNGITRKSGKNKSSKGEGVDEGGSGGDNLGCIYCSSVYHAACLPSSSVSPSPSSSPSTNTITCPPCFSNITQIQQTYLTTKHEIYTTHLHMHYATLITSKWRSLVALSRYRTLQRFLVRLQAMARAFKLRHTFKGVRRSRMRSLKIKFIGVYNVVIADWIRQCSHPYVHVTVLDGHGKQIHEFTTRVARNCTTVEYEENLQWSIPGVAGNSKIVFTVISKDDIRSIFVGQAILNLSPRPNQEIWRIGGKFRLQLDTLHHLPKDLNGQDLKLDYFLFGKEGGWIDVEIVPCSGLTNFCGYLMAGGIEDEGSNVGGGSGGGGGGGSELSDGFGAIGGGGGGRVRRFWVMLLENTLYIYPSLSGPLKLKLNLSKCQIDISTSTSSHSTSKTNNNTNKTNTNTNTKNNSNSNNKITFILTTRTNQEYTFTTEVGNEKERDFWRMVIECSNDLYSNYKRSGNGINNVSGEGGESHRIKSAVSLMKRKNFKGISGFIRLNVSKGKHVKSNGNVNVNGSGGGGSGSGVKSTNTSMSTKNSAQSPSQSSSSMTTGIGMKNTARRKNQHTDLPQQTLSEKNNHNHDHGATLNFGEQNTNANASSSTSTSNKNVLAGRASSTSTGGGLDQEFYQAFNPNKQHADAGAGAPVRIKFPALQRKTNSTSSALFGQLNYTPGVKDVRDFKFNKSNRCKASGSK